MNRKIAFILVIFLSIIFIALGVISIIITEKPIDKEFNGIVRDYKRTPGLIVFHLYGQKEKFVMGKNLEKFKKSLSIGDSISKPKGELNIYIYKKEEKEFTLYRKFRYDY